MQIMISDLHLQEECFEAGELRSKSSSKGQVSMLVIYYVTDGRIITVYYSYD